MDKPMFNLTKKDQSSSLNDVMYFYPLLPLRDVVVFPNVVVPLFVGRDKSIKALEYAMSHQKEVFLSAQKDAKVDTPSPKDIYKYGTLSTVLQLLKLPDGTVKALIEGKERGMIESFVDKQDYYMVEITKLSGLFEVSAETQALLRTIIAAFEKYAKLNTKISQEAVSTVTTIDDPVKLGDTIAGHLALKVSDKQELLETVDVNRRLEKLYEKITAEIDILMLENRLRSRVKKQKPHLIIFLKISNLKQMKSSNWSKLPFTQMWH